MSQLYLLSNNQNNYTDNTIVMRDGMNMHPFAYSFTKTDNKIRVGLFRSIGGWTLQPKEKLLDAFYRDNKVNKELNDFSIAKLYNKVGIHYPRVYRPYLYPESGVSREITVLEKLERIILNYPDSQLDINLIVSNLNQLAVLIQMLDEVFRSVHPSLKNLNAFGHNIKNVLILACIEVESNLKSIYKEHAQNAKRNYSTSDYIKLKPILHLNKYSLRLPLYPDFGSVSPFKKWSEKRGATKSLFWYNDYNPVKHNSETHLNRATLNAAVNAVAAVAILIQAQFGPNIPYWREEIGSYFEMTTYPTWKNKDKILPPLQGEAWSEMKLNI
jgi:hypothetical protein